MSITADIKDRAYALGYDLCGVIRADSLKEYLTHLDERMQRFPESRHLYEALYDLGSPEKKAEWAKSVVVCVRRYGKYKIPAHAAKYFGKVYLVDGRLPNSKECKDALLFEEFLGNLGAKAVRGIAAARLAAAKAGLGKFGKNNFLYTKFGSWVWIDTWTVNMELEYDPPSAVTQVCPENCRMCIDACPTRALSDSFAMDRGTCVAQLSFFSSELPSDRLKDRMGIWLYGCDVCQDVCPKNRGKWVEEQEFPGLDSIAGLLFPEKIAEMDDKTFLEEIQPRFWYIGKEGFWLWKCNALRAMANSSDPKYHGYIRQALSDSDEKVRAMAIWACNKVRL